jgi:small-conductance mechanosensitive channel
MKRDNVRSMFETRSHSWAEVGLAKQLSRAAVKRARLELLLLLPILVGVIVVYTQRKELFGPDLALPVRIASVVVMLILGWSLARAAGRSLGPMLFRRMDPATAGTVGFLIRLATILITFFAAANIAGLSARSLTLGGAFTAVVLGLAAQQTLGNLFAGLVLLSARPFRVGERVKLQGAGIVAEGVVSQLGLLYTVFADGEDEIMIPNSVVLNVAVVPLREPDAVDMRARLRPGVTPTDIQNMLEEQLETPLLDRPRIILEELDGDEVVVRIQATPIASNDGPRLATEILSAVSSETRSTEDRVAEHVAARGSTGDEASHDARRSDDDAEDERERPMTPPSHTTDAAAADRQDTEGGTRRRPRYPTAR